MSSHKTQTNKTHPGEEFFPFCFAKWHERKCRVQVIEKNRSNRELILNPESHLSVVHSCSSFFHSFSHAFQSPGSSRRFLSIRWWESITNSWGILLSALDSIWNHCTWATDAMILAVSTGNLESNHKQLPPQMMISVVMVVGGICCSSCDPEFRNMRSIFKTDDRSLLYHRRSRRCHCK